jgi:hypothetical protein
MARNAIQFEQAEAVYAESINPNFCFDEIIGIDLGSGQTRTLEEIVLPVDVNMGKSELMLGKDHYELVIKSVRVWLDKTNCDYLPGTRYGGCPSSIEEIESLESEEKRENLWSAKIASKLSLTKQFVEAAGDAGRTSAKRQIQKKSITRAIPFAQTEGAHAVRVVLPEGVSGGLTGPVIAAVASDNSLTPFCRLVAKDIDQPVTGRLRVQARPSDMHLRRLNKVKRSMQDTRLGERGLRAGAKSLEARQKAEDQTLREKVAGLALVMPVSRDSGQHLDLATKGFCFYPHSDDETK